MIFFHSKKLKWSHRITTLSSKITKKYLLRELNLMLLIYQNFCSDSNKNIFKKINNNIEIDLKYQYQCLKSTKFKLIGN